MNISVVIPTYNRKDMVERALNSVINQKIKAMEIIVVDDGSTDGTDDLFPVKGVVYHKIDHCGYPGRVRNIGVELAGGDYIAFLDSDDIWYPEKLDRQIEYLRNHPDCRILHTKERWLMNGKFVSQKKRKHKREGDLFKDSLQGCIIGPSTVLIEKRLFNEFGGFKSNIEVGEDYDLWLRITDRIRVGYINEELIEKNAGHGDQLSFKYGYIEPFKIEVLEKLLSNYEFRDNNRKSAYESLKKKYEIIINGCLKRGKEKEAQLYKERRAMILD